MAEKKGGGGKPQTYDESSGRYVADYAAFGTQELRERQIIEIPANAEHPPVEKAIGFNRLDTKHHQRHAREMGICASSSGLIHTFMRFSEKKFEDIRRQNNAYEIYR